MGRFGEARGSGVEWGERVKQTSDELHCHREGDLQTCWNHAEPHPPTGKTKQLKHRCVY